MHLPSSSTALRAAISVLFVPVCLAVLSGAADPLQTERSPRPRITGISHIALRVSDADAARRFYGGVLGLHEMESAGGRIVFAVGERQRVVLEPTLRPGEDERLSHLAFETPDVKALAGALSSRGLRVEASGGDESAAIRVADPDGHTLEFVEVSWPPARATPDATSRALSTRMLHAGLTVKDEAAAHAFYRDALGFSEIWRGGRPEGVTQWVNMRVPDGTEYVEYMLTATRPDRARLGTMHHLCLVVPDIQAAFEEAARRAGDASGPLPGPPNVGVNGRWQLNLYDPDGTRVELMEPFRIR
jgi:lactoylglutathione lyase